MNIVDTSKLRIWVGFLRCQNELATTSVVAVVFLATTAGMGGGRCAKHGRHVKARRRCAQAKRMRGPALMQARSSIVRRRAQWGGGSCAIIPALLALFACAELLMCTLHTCTATVSAFGLSLCSWRPCHCCKSLVNARAPLVVSGFAGGVVGFGLTAAACDRAVAVV